MDFFEGLTLTGTKPKAGYEVNDILVHLTLPKEFTKMYLAMAMKTATPKEEKEE